MGSSNSIWPISGTQACCSALLSPISLQPHHPIYKRSQPDHLDSRLIAGLWAIMTLIPVPGYGPGNLTPQGNLESFIDQHFLPGKFCCFIYGDNEGYLSTIPSIATVLFGVLCGHLVRSSQSSQKKLQILAGGGILSLASVYCGD